MLQALTQQFLDDISHHSICCTSDVIINRDPVPGQIGELAATSHQDGHRPVVVQAVDAKSNHSKDEEG